MGAADMPARTNPLENIVCVGLWRPFEWKQRRSLPERPRDRLALTMSVMRGVINQDTDSGDGLDKTKRLHPVICMPSSL